MKNIINLALRSVIIALSLLSLFFIFLTAEIVNTKVYWDTFIAFSTIIVAIIIDQITIFFNNRKIEKLKGLIK